MHRILIVDDSAGSAAVLQKLLGLYGYKVACAGDGRQGLEALKQFVPHLVILDLRMPVLDGYGFLEEMRKRSEASDAPVMIFTADQFAERSRLDGLGISGFYYKASTKFETLLEDLTRCLSIDAHS